VCLAADIADLKARLSRILVGFDVRGEPVTAGRLGASGSMAALLHDALRPNLCRPLRADRPSCTADRSETSPTDATR